MPRSPEARDGARSKIRQIELVSNGIPNTEQCQRFRDVLAQVFCSQPKGADPRRVVSDLLTEVSGMGGNEPALEAIDALDGEVARLVRVANGELDIYETRHVGGALEGGKWVDHYEGPTVTLGSLAARLDKVSLEKLGSRLLRLYAALSQAMRDNQTDAVAPSNGVNGTNGDAGGGGEKRPKAKERRVAEQRSASGAGRRKAAHSKTGERRRLGQ